MRGIVLIGVILGLVYWAASTVDLPAQFAAGATADQHAPQWRRTSAGWLTLEDCSEKPYHEGSALHPVTLMAFEILLAMFVMVAFSQSAPALRKHNG